MQALGKARQGWARLRSLKIDVLELNPGIEGSFLKILRLGVAAGAAAATPGAASPYPS